MTDLFLPLKDETRRLLKRLPGIIDRTFPLPVRFRANLPRDVSELSGLLTSSRENRGASYLGKPALLSAYLRYFLPWNIYRLCRLLDGLPLDLKSSDVINDIGTGPLTLAASLWICRPALRNIPLEFRCVDRTAAVMEAGKKLFRALTANDGKSPNENPQSCPWIIKTIRGELKRGGTLSVELKGKPAALSAAVNIYNELFWNFSPHDLESLEHFANNHARLLSSLTESTGSVLIVEPGIPRSGEFISLIRSGFIRESRVPLSPCTHCEICPLPGGRISDGGKEKWCHFAFDTENAPEELHKLSAAAGLPKERAVLSFILAGPVSKENQSSQAAKIGPPPFRSAKSGPLKIRIISDSFPIQDSIKKTSQKEKGTGKILHAPLSWGRYGCSKKGLVLVKGSREKIDASPSGSLEELALMDGETDGKSGALVAKK